MQQQPLAFTLVKTVVSARDEGKVLSPALATAWDLLRTELSPAHRVIASEVSWSPNHQEDLRFVIEGVRKQFEKDPELEGEFLAFLAEVEPFGDGNDDTAILPALSSTAIGSEVVDIALDKQEAIVEPISAVEQHPILLEPEVQQGILDDSIGEASTKEEVNTLDETPEVDEPKTEVEEPEVQEPISEVDPINAEVDQVEQLETPREEKFTELEKRMPIETSENYLSRLLSFWPYALGAALFAVVAFIIWDLSIAETPESNISNSTESGIFE